MAQSVAQNVYKLKCNVKVINVRINENRYPASHVCVSITACTSGLMGRKFIQLPGELGYVLQQ